MFSLPNHWRFSSLWMASLQKVGTHLARSTSAPRHLTKCAIDCCDVFVPASLTLSGGTACVAAAAGTYSVSPHPSIPCQYVGTHSPGTSCTVGVLTYNVTSVEIVVSVSADGTVGAIVRIWWNGVYSAEYGTVESGPRSCGGASVQADTHVSFTGLDFIDPGPPYPTLTIA